MRKLQGKQKRFCELLVLDNQDPKTALQLAGYTFNAKKESDNNINMGHAIRRIMSSIIVKEYIAELRSGKDIAEDVDRSYVIKRLKSMAESAEGEPTKLKAIELLGKTLGMFSDKQQEEDEKSNPAMIAKNAFRDRMKVITKEQQDETQSGTDNDIEASID